MSSFKFDPESVRNESRSSNQRSNSVPNQETNSITVTESTPVSPTMPGLATNGSSDVTSITRNKQSYPILTYLNVFPETESERKISMCDSIEEVVGPCQALDREPLFSGKYLELSKYHFKDASGKEQSAEGNNQRTIN